MQPIFTPTYACGNCAVKRNVNINEGCLSGMVIQWVLFICQKWLHQCTLCGQIECFRVINWCLSDNFCLPTQWLSLLGRRVAIHQGASVERLNLYFSHKDKNEVECIASGPFKGYLDMKCKYWLKLNPSIEFNSCLLRHKTILLLKWLIIKLWYNMIYTHEETSFFSKMLTGNEIAFFSVLFFPPSKQIYQKK